MRNLISTTPMRLLSRHTLGNLDFIAKVVNTGYQVATCNAHESNLYPGNVYSISKNVTVSMLFLFCPSDTVWLHFRLQDTLSGCKAISDKPDADAQLILDALNKGLFGGQPAESSASLQNHAVENGPATGTAQSTQISAASSSVPFIASGIPVPSASGAATHNATANTTAGGGNSTTLRNNAAATSAGGNSTQTAGALDMRAGGREMVFALGTASVVALGAVLVL